MAPWGRVLPLLAAAAVLTACTAPAGVPVEPSPSAGPAQPPRRTSWALEHSVVTSKQLRVTGRTVSDFEESTSVASGSSGSAGGSSCSVSLSVTGWGGPQNMVGEKVETRFRGRPAVRSGAGAEGDYLMWQRSDGRWVLVTCEQPGSAQLVDTVAAAVRFHPSSIALPFHLAALPAGYVVSQVRSDSEGGSARVYVERTGGRSGGDDAGIEISYETGAETTVPTGRAVTVNGRPALRNEEPRSPGVCVLVQQRYVCVRTASSDTGPYPDRTDELPTLTSIAASLRFAPDLGDSATWFAADHLVG